MLVNGAHLLPDGAGALIWPRQHLVAVAEPQVANGSRTAPAMIKLLATLLRRRRPRAVIWLGPVLPALFDEGGLARSDAAALTELVAAHDWTWVRADEHVCGPLTFRLDASPDAPPGEVAARPAPQAVLGGRDGPVALPCYAFDGRRVLLPGFGGLGRGSDVLSPPFKPLFRRPFTVLIAAGGRIRTLTRAKLEAESPRRPEPATPRPKSPGVRMRLGDDDFTP